MAQRRFGSNRAAALALLLALCLLTSHAAHAESLSGGDVKYYHDGTNGTLNLSGGAVWVITWWDLDLNGFTGPLNLVYGDDGSGSGWENFPIQIHAHFSGPGGHLLQAYDKWWGGPISSHGLNPGDGTNPFDVRVYINQNPDNTWHIQPYLRLDGGSWTPFWDGPFDSAEAFDLTASMLMLQFDPSGSGTVYYEPPTASLNIVCDPDPEYLSAADPTKTIAVNYLGGGGGLLYGYSVSFTWDDAIASASAASVSEGTLLSDVGGTFFFPFDVSGNEILVDCSLLGLQPGAAGPGTMFTIEFTGLAVGTSDIDITVLEARDPDNVHLSGFNEDDGLLIVDVSAPTVADVLIWNDTLGHTDDYIKNGDTARVTATVLDDDPVFGIGNITADLQGLGGGATDPPTTYNALTGAAVWTATITSVTCLPLNGTVMVTVSAADAIGNPAAPGSDTIIADNIAPTAVLDFDAAPGHEKCNLTWTLGTDLYLEGTVIQRNDNVGEYPTYPLFVGAWPVVDAYYPGDYSSGTNVFTGAGTTASDGVIPRNIYYYQAFCYDIARNYGLAATTARDLATNYYLGDVTTTLGFWNGYNGYVNDADIDKLGGTYQVVGPAWPDNQCDVGPTVHPDNNRLGLPLPDAWIEFEDLMIFAMNYGRVSPRVVPFLPEESSKALSLVLAELGASGEGLVEIAVRLEGNAIEVKGLSTVIAYGSSDLEFVNARLSDDMSSPLAPVFFWHGSDGSSVQIDLAVLGTDVTVGGSGEVAVMTFRVLSDEYTLEFESATVRSGANEDLVAGFEGIASKPGVPMAFRLVGNLPNPFNPVTKIAYELPHEADVAIRIYDVSGRLVRTLVDQRIEPGRHEAIWNGRNENGEPVGSGVYFCTMDAEEFHGSHKMTLLK